MQIAQLGAPYAEEYGIALAAQADTCAPAADQPQSLSVSVSGSKS